LFGIRALGPRDVRDDLAREGVALERLRPLGLVHTVCQDLPSSPF
jgi:hypothetical protein